MSTVLSWDGEIPFCKEELNLDLTLLGGQSFRWKKGNCAMYGDFWQGVAFDCFWILGQTSDSLKFKVYCSKCSYKEQISSEYFTNLLKKYFNIGFDLSVNLKNWSSAHQHFKEASQKIKAVRILQQDPLENMFSFICSQNNHIKRITSMIETFCSKYGREICTFNGKQYYAFPTLESLLQNQETLEQNLRTEKFGYRAKFISQAVKRINELGGMNWFDKLRNCTYSEARLELISLPGIGFKVADCICLMSLGHFEAVPIDTHIYKISQQVYLPHLKGIKAVTPRIYDDIADNFRFIYGKNAGWAQAVLFCSGLQQSKERELQNSPDKIKRAKIN